MSDVGAKLSEQVSTFLAKRLEEKSLILPAPPVVLTKLLPMLRSPNYTPKEASSVIELDAVLAARIIRSANTVQNAGVERVKNLHQALTRLGQEKLKSILVEYSAKRLFESRNDQIADATRGLWNHSLAVAMLSRDVAALCGAEDVEGAYLAGLLHDVGKPVVAAFLLEAEKTVSGTRTNVWIEPDVFVEVINQVHRPIGVAMSQKWLLPDAIAAVIKDCTEYNNDDRLSHANCVRFSNALAKRENVYVGTVDQADAEALIMIGRSLLGIDDNVLSRLTVGLIERVQKAASA